MKSIIKERGSAAYQLFLLALSVYVFIVLVLEAFVVRDPEVEQVLQYVDFAICFIFLADFFLNLAYAENRIGYLKWGWIDLVASIPAVDPLRWGRLSRVVRILRFLRSIKSMKILINAIQRSRLESLTLFTFLVVFLAFTLSSALILEFERNSGSGLDTAGKAITWSALNLLNAKVPFATVHSTGGAVITVLLNKVGLLIFAYFNAVIIAWLLSKKKDSRLISDEAV